MRTSPDGREQVLSFIKAGEVFNEIGESPKAKLRQSNRAGRIRQRGDPAQGVGRDRDRASSSAMQIIEMLANHITMLATLAADLSLKTVDARFIQLLLDQAETMRSNSDGGKIRPSWRQGWGQFPM
ncbi:MAG TPA: hypothetical protein PLE14_05920 [Anaerolineales bacterium]|nr:hypothetical protein [Anaerolineales bacterium]HNO30613.1 hypothetical protein [Anaerolineales bacterium]